MRLWRRRDTSEAKRLAEEIGLEVVRRAPDALRLLMDVPDRFTVTAGSGIVYQVVVEAWAGSTANSVHVSVSVDGGPVSAFLPVGWGDDVELAD